LEVRVTTDDSDFYGKNVINKKVLLDDIHENMLGDVGGTKVNTNLMDNVLGEIVERMEGVLRPAMENQQQNQVRINK